VEYRDLPSIDELLREPDVACLPRPLALLAARETLDEARDAIGRGEEPGAIVDRVVALTGDSLAPRLRRVVNATGVILHTNLGRAPLPAEALARVTAAAGYSNLEYDLTRGNRGSRQDKLPAVLRRLTGAEDALVVNNNAAALLLVLAAFAKEREVVVSRGELLEIGDGFRIPDILAESGARIREVGTTNRTRASDYEEAIGPDTALLLRVHPSNFRVVGFSERPTVSDLAALAHEHGIPLVDDLGSGCLLEIGDEPLVSASLASGADLVTFSGDKLLGGPQAGIVCGRRDLIERLRRHQLQRALRPDKLTLAALEGTLLLYLDPELARRAVPVLRMIEEPLADVRRRAEHLASLTGGEVVESQAAVGGGSLPGFELPSAACAVELRLEERLRAYEPAVIGVVRGERLLLDCRTIADDEVELVARGVADCRAT
jgi:L-seryl-tRNA(Ser) seleniumtransferase